MMMMMMMMSTWTYTLMNCEASASLPPSPSLPLSPPLSLSPSLSPKFCQGLIYRTIALKLKNFINKTLFHCTVDFIDSKVTGS